MKEGIVFIRDREGLSALVVLAFCTTLFGFSLTGFLPVIVRTIFNRGPGTYEMLLVCSGAGSICGALIVAAMEKMKGQGRLAVLALAALGIATAGFAFSKWLPLSCLLIFLAGTAVMASASLMLSLVQLIVVDSMRGRVMSVYNLAFRAGIPLGALVLGKLDSCARSFNRCSRFRIGTGWCSRLLSDCYDKDADLSASGQIGELIRFQAGGGSQVAGPFHAYWLFRQNHFAGAAV